MIAFCGHYKDSLSYAITVSQVKDVIGKLEAHKSDSNFTLTSVITSCLPSHIALLYSS